MASIRKERTIEVSPEEAWAALGDWAAPHERLDGTARFVWIADLPRTRWRR